MTAGVPGWLLSGTMLAAGVGIPVMAALNAGLGIKLGSSVYAAVILFSVALATSLLLALLRPVPVSLSPAPPYFYGAGLIIAFYLLSITAISPRLGVGNAVFLVLLGQLVAASVIDHLGLFGVPRFPFDPARALGLVVMALGVFLTRRPPL